MWTVGEGGVGTQSEWSNSTTVSNILGLLSGQDLTWEDAVRPVRAILSADVAEVGTTDEMLNIMRNAGFSTTHVLGIEGLGGIKGEEVTQGCERGHGGDTSKRG